MVKQEIETRNKFNALQEDDAEIMCITKDQDQIAQVQEDDQRTWEDENQAQLGRDHFEEQYDAEEIAGCRHNRSRLAPTSRDVSTGSIFGG